jgi:hypothetical protein
VIIDKGLGSFMHFNLLRRKPIFDQCFDKASFILELCRL